MIENILFERIAMSGELVRMAIAIAGTSVAAWFDLRNNKNVPDNMLYGFLAAALLCNVVFFQQEIFIYGVAVAAILGALGYAAYRVGYIGGADVYVIASIALLVPVFPSGANAVVNTPPVLSIIVYSGVLFSLYFLYFIVSRLVLTRAAGKMEYLLLLPVYAILIYFLYTSGMFSPLYMATVSILIVASIIFMVYKESLMRAMAKEVPIGKIEDGDIAAVELMGEDAKKYNIKKLLDNKEIARLKKLKVGRVLVYTGLPPFLPFVLAGLLLALFIGDLMVSAISIGAAY